MARRIAAIVLLEPALDANYQAAKDATYSLRFNIAAQRFATFRLIASSSTSPASFMGTSEALL
jgi:hypothetical protein